MSHVMNITEFPPVFICTVFVLCLFAFFRLSSPLYYCVTPVSYYRLHLPFRVLDFVFL